MLLYLSLDVTFRYVHSNTVLYHVTSAVYGVYTGQFTLFCIKYKVYISSVVFVWKIEITGFASSSDCEEESEIA